MTVATTLVGDFFTGADRDRFVGLQSAAMAAGGIVFLLGGGLLAELSWRGPFLIYGLAFLVAPLAMVALSTPTARNGGDAPAVKEETNPQTGVIAFLYAAAFLNQVAFYMLPTQLPFLAVESFDARAATMTGALIATQTLFAAIAALNFRPLHATFSRLTLFAIGFGGTGLAYLLLSVADGPALFAVMVLAGLSGGTMMPNLQSWIVGTTRSATRGRVVGGLSSLTFFGQFMSPILLAPIVAGVGLRGSFLAVGVFLMLLAIALALVALRPSARDTEAPGEEDQTETDRKSEGRS